MDDTQNKPVDLSSPVRHKTYAKLLHHTPIWLLPYAIRKCSGTTKEMDTDTEAKDFGPKDRKLIAGKCLKLGRPFDPLDPPHESVLEHIGYNFELFFSRAVLQELARTRIGISLSVGSTRLALKKLLEGLGYENLKEIKLLINNTGDEDIDNDSRDNSQTLRDIKNAGLKTTKQNMVFPNVL